MGPVPLFSFVRYEFSRLDVRKFAVEFSFRSIFSFCIQQRKKTEYFLHQKHDS